MEEGQFGVKQQPLHGVKLWWICQRRGGRLIPYSDVFAPTGYGFKSRARALVIAQEIEDRLAVGMPAKEQA